MHIMNAQIYGEDYVQLLKKAKEEGYALPAVNVVSNGTVNAALEAAAQVGSDIILQISAGGAQFFAGKSVADDFQAKVQGAVAFAEYSKRAAKLYGVRVVLHTDHANRSLVPWIEALIEEGEKYYEKYSEPLFSSHMLDLSEEPLEENVATCKELLPKMTKIETAMEFELGLTGGEEDGVDNEGVENSKLYTQPEEVLYAYDELDGLGVFSIAAAFGNVHGVYKPGSVDLRPDILDNTQELITEKRGNGPKPVSFVFHGGSGSAKDKIKEAIGYGVFKMNIDTDTQFAFAKPVRDYIVENEYRMARQIGSQDDPNAPNKKIIDPRKWLRLGEEGLRDRLVEAFEDLQSVGKKLA
jgi:fructose-bisphosphate aldolase class II